MRINLYPARSRVFFHHEPNPEEGAPIPSGSIQPKTQKTVPEAITIDSLPRTSIESLKRKGFPHEHARIIFDETFKSVERMTEPPINVKDEVRKVIDGTKPLTFRNMVIRNLPVYTPLATLDGLHMYNALQGSKDLKSAAEVILIDSLFMAFITYKLSKVKGLYIPSFLPSFRGIYINVNQENDDDETDPTVNPQKEFERELRHTTSHEISHYYFFCTNNVQNGFAVVRTFEEALQTYDHRLPEDISKFFKKDEKLGLKDLNEGLIADAMDNRFIGLKKLIRYIIPEPNWTYDYGENLGKHLFVLSGNDYKRTYTMLRLMGKGTPFEQAVKTAHGLGNLSDKDFKDHILKTINEPEVEQK